MYYIFRTQFLMTVNFSNHTYIKLTKFKHPNIIYIVNLKLTNKKLLVLANNNQTFKGSILIN